MNTSYYKCGRCGKFYIVNDDNLISLGSYDVILGDKITLCNECFEKFKNFCSGKEIKAVERKS